MKNKDNQNAWFNCRDRKGCSLNGNCLIDNVIYKATNNERKYIGTTKLNWKKECIVITSASPTKNQYYIIKIRMANKKLNCQISLNKMGFKLLNKKNELIYKFQHINKFLLCHLSLIDLKMYFPNIPTYFRLFKLQNSINNNHVGFDLHKHPATRQNPHTFVE